MLEDICLLAEVFVFSTFVKSGIMFLLKKHFLCARHTEFLATLALELHDKLNCYMLVTLPVSLLLSYFIIHSFKGDMPNLTKIFFLVYQLLLESIVIFAS